MKFGYDGANLSELISHYKIIDDKIEITFLSDNKSEIPFTEENESKLLECMIEQAEKRNFALALTNGGNRFQKEFLVDTTTDCTMVAVIVGANIMNLSLYDKVGPLNVAGYAMTLSGVAFLYLSYARDNGLFGRNSKLKKSSELKKYDIYLTLREQLENMSDARVYDGISMSDEKININTLDNYSLRDLKKVRKNLIKLEKTLSYADKENKDSKIHQLVKK